MAICGRLSSSLSIGRLWTHGSLRDSIGGIEAPARPRSVRETIENNKDELLEYGTLRY